MTDLQMWSLVVGFALPPVLAIVMQAAWPSSAKAVVAFVACAIGGAGTAFFEAKLNGRTFVQSALVVLVTSIATYTGFWKPTQVAPTIERKTTLGGGGAPAA